MKVWIIRILLIVLTLGILLKASATWAGPRCGPQSGVLAALGSHGSLDVVQQRVSTSASGGLSCNRGGIAIYGKDWVKVKLEDNAGGLLRNAVTGDTLPFQVYLSKDMARPLTVGQDVELSEFSWWGNLGGADIPLFFSTQPNHLDSVAAGTYTATLRVRWYWQICPGTQFLKACLVWGGWDRSQGLVGLCVTGCSGVSDWGAGEVASIIVSVTVTNQCEMVARELNFGSAPLVEAFGPASGVVQVRCTKGSSYTVGLSPGNHADGAVRRMSNGTHFLAYELYKSNAGADRWGHLGDERRASSEADVAPGLLDGITPQSFNYRGVILQDRPTPPAGTYVDHVVVDVQF